MNFTHIENIGQGGFGKVDKVTNDQNVVFARKTFAINQGPGFPPNLADNVKRRFVREANIQSGISHKNIIPIEYKDLAANPPYFVMPLAKASLADDIKKDRTLGGNFMNAMIDIISALEELHSMRFYHRDLKPANVLRFEDENGQSYYAIGDFGLMSVGDLITGLSALTQTGMKMNSDYYTAPEVVKELRNASPQSDIYSLGCILHDFVGLEQRVPCAEIKEKGDFAGILLNCTREDPKRRFKSVVALRDALLSLGDINVQASTEEGAGIFNILEKEFDSITEDEWKSIVNFIEDKYEGDDAISVLRRLTIDHIEFIIAKYPELSKRLGLMYAEWIRNNSFQFEECDGLSIRLEKFVNSSTIDVQSECLMAMLYLGTNHNRFYVERKFVGHIGKYLDESLAKRLAVEIRADEGNACYAIRHLEFSISTNREYFHPIIVEAIKDVCK